MITLDELVLLVQALVNAELKVAEAEKVLSDAKNVEQRLREETIPNAMLELDLEKVKLSTGQTITIKQDVHARIPVDQREAAFTWLESNGFGGLIKTNVITEFGKGELDKAIALADSLKESGVDAFVKRDIHYQTMAAFLREQIVAAADVPLDMFGATPIWTTKIK